MEPVKALGRAGILGNFLNNFDGSVEVLDDLDDHWTAKNHKEERRFVVEDLQDLAADKSCRVTVLSGDVHLAAVGQFYSNPRTHRLAKHKDFRYMPNVISSAVANAPPPDLMADVLNRRNKVHHFDADTDEDMIPLFTTGVDGRPRNNKRLLPHRNWCSIREYQPGFTPPPTPPPGKSATLPRGEVFEDDDQDHDVRDGSPADEARNGRGMSRGGSILRRLSLSRNRGPSVKPDAPNPAAPTDRSRPPLSGGSFMRSFSMIRRRGSTASQTDMRPTAGAGSGGGNGLKLTRTRSLGGGGSSGSIKNFLFRRGSVDQQRPPTRRPGDEGAMNDGAWPGGSAEYTDSEEDFYDAPLLRPQTQQQRGPGTGGFRPQQQYQPGNGAGVAPMMSLRGGAPDPRAVNMEFEAGDDAHFQATPRRAYTQPALDSSSPFQQPGAGGSGNNWDRHYDYDDDDLSDDSFVYRQPQPQPRAQPPPPQPQPPQRSKTLGASANLGLSTGNNAVAVVSSEPTIRPFYRTPTGLDAKALRKLGGGAGAKGASKDGKAGASATVNAADFDVDLQGGLDICLNVEVNPRDPAGITTPYRLLVPRLWYEDEEEQLAQLQAEAEAEAETAQVPQPRVQDPGPGRRSQQLPDQHRAHLANMIRDDQNFHGKPHQPPAVTALRQQHQQHQRSQSLDDLDDSDFESDVGSDKGRAGRSGGGLGGGIKRWFSGRRTKSQSQSQYRAHRGGDGGADEEQAPGGWYQQ